MPKEIMEIIEGAIKSIWKKKCFICNKKGCWSSKHIREKRKDLKNKFKKHFSQTFDKQASQYIAEYKGVDYEIDNNIESIDKAAEALMIDVKFLLSGKYFI